VRSAVERRRHNRPIRSKVKTYVAKAEGLVAGDDDVAAEEAVRQAISTIDKTVRKGIIHPNNASRRKSRLTKKFNVARAARPLEKK